MFGAMEASVKRKIEVGVGSLSEALDRFERTWAGARKRAGRAAEIRLTFESLPVLLANLLVALHSAAAAEALTLARKAGLDLDVALDVLTSSAATSAMLKVRGPMIVRGDFTAQMKLDLFMKDIHLMQEAAKAVGAPLPFTDLAERLYAAAQAACYGSEDLAIVVKALEAAG